MNVLSFSYINNREVKVTSKINRFGRVYWRTVGSQCVRVSLLYQVPIYNLFVLLKKNSIKVRSSTSDVNWVIGDDLLKDQVSPFGTIKNDRKKTVGLNFKLFISPCLGIQGDGLTP